VPTLLLHGEDDQVVPIAASALEAVKLLPNGSLKTYPGLSHGMLTVNADDAERRPSGVRHALKRRRARRQEDEEMSRLEGKTAVVRGGATGIGFASAKRFIAEGTFVFLFGHTQSALDEAVAKLGPNARAVTGSINETADLNRLFETVRDERGSIDILLANAAISDTTPLGQIAPDQFGKSRKGRDRACPACDALRIVTLRR
jgi:short subunit dehydrogenase